MTRLMLVRHGESNAIVGRMIGGHRSCTGLSLLGRHQAAVLNGRWKAHHEVAPDVVIENASITELQLVRTGLWRLMRYNDAAHLAGLPA